MQDDLMEFLLSEVEKRKDANSHLLCKRQIQVTVNNTRRNTVPWIPEVRASFGLHPTVWVFGVQYQKSPKCGSGIWLWLALKNGRVPKYLGLTIATRTWYHYPSILAHAALVW
jgi:hypothetical protein